MARILRLLEYTYDTAERADEDMSLWKTPANGVMKFGPGKTMRSAVITDLFSVDLPGEFDDPLLPTADELSNWCFHTDNEAIEVVREPQLELAYLLCKRAGCGDKHPINHDDIPDIRKNWRPKRLEEL